MVKQGNSSVLVTVKFTWYELLMALNLALILGRKVSNVDLFRLGSCLKM